MSLAYFNVNTSYKLDLNKLEKHYLNAYMKFFYKNLYNGLREIKNVKMSLTKIVCFDCKNRSQLSNMNKVELRSPGDSQNQL